VEVRPDLARIILENPAALRDRVLEIRKGREG
jgi:hypothetical protein